MEQKQEDDWRKLSEEVLMSMNAWRKAHPKATLREIEQEAHARMSRLEAQLIQETAQESTSREWSGNSASERPLCPICQTPLLSRGKRARHLQAAGGHTVTLNRAYGTCPECGTGLFPPR
jgi:rubrerythrin